MATEIDRQLFINHIKEEAKRIDIDYCLVIEGGEHACRASKNSGENDPYVMHAIYTHEEFAKYNGKNKRTFKDFHNFIRKILSRDIKAELIASEFVLNLYPESFRLPQYWLKVYQNGQYARLMRRPIPAGIDTEIMAFHFDCSGVRDRDALIKLYFAENDSHTEVMHSEDIANGGWLDQFQDKATREEVRAVLMDILINRK